MNNAAQNAAKPQVARRRTMKLSEAVTREIVSDISGLPPGTMLPPEAKLLEKYRVGRASLREALRLLENQGLIIIRPGPGGGPMVAQADSEHFGQMASLFFHMASATFRDILEARLILEPALAAKLAEQHDPEHVRALEAFLRRSEADTSSSAETDGSSDLEDEPSTEKALAFHTMLVEMSDNPVTMLLTHCLQEQGVEAYHENMVGPDDQREIDLVHESIARAIIAGDPARTELLMREHMLHFRSIIMARRPSLFDEVVSWREFNP
jgi:DNA-binding FadR family transcriptional regulator